MSVEVSNWKHDRSLLIVCDVETDNFQTALLNNAQNLVEMHAAAKDVSLIKPNVTLMMDICEKNGEKYGQVHNRSLIV